MPIALKRVTSASGGRLRRAATIRDSGVISVASPISAASRRAAEGLSATTSEQRRTRSLESSRRSGVIAPIAFTWAPAATIAASSSGSRARVAVVMIGHPSTASKTERASVTRKAKPEAARRATNAARRSAVGLNTRTRERGRTAATAATCGRACFPVPMSASSAASLRASQRVATPETAPVRSCPRTNASITALRRPEPLSQRMRSGVAPPAVWAQVLVPTNPALAASPPSACRLCPSPHTTWVLSMVCAPAEASSASQRSTAAIASGRLTRLATSASVSQSGSSAVEAVVRDAIVKPGRSAKWG